MPEKSQINFAPDHLPFHNIFSNGAQNAEKFLLSTPVLRSVSEPNSPKFGSVSRTSAGKPQFASTDSKDVGWN
jgi:hypothetical protein